MSVSEVGPITAVVCNYNGERYLAECLRSVSGQEGVDEILLVDDASTDGSLELVEREFPGVGILALAENRGPGAARNAGMRAARNRWVLAVDNDAVLAPGVALELGRVAAAHAKCVAVQPRSVIDDDPDTVHYDGGSFHYVGLLALRNFYRPLASVEEHGDVLSRALIGISPLVDRDAVLSHGGYDEDLFYLAEDFDLALRLALAGFEVRSTGAALVRHKGGTAGLSFRGGGYPGKRAYLHSRNRWVLMAKAYRWRTLLVLAPGILSYELVWTLFSLLQGHLGAHLAGKRDFFKTLPATLRKRRAVQANRTVSDRELLVGGPLTFSPSLVERPAARLAARLLDGWLRLWWRLARPMCG